MDIGALKGFGCLSLPAGQVSSEGLAPMVIGVAKHRQFLDLFAYFLGQCQKVCGVWGKAPSVPLRLRVGGEWG